MSKLSVIYATALHGRCTVVDYTDMRNKTPDQKWAAQKLYEWVLQSEVVLIDRNSGASHGRKKTVRKIMNESLDSLAWQRVSFSIS